MNSFKIELVVAIALIALWTCCIEAKLLRRSRYYDDIGGYDSTYGPGAMGAMPTGERAILTVRGTRNPYDGSAPSKIAIEDQPHRGPLPRGVYDRLDAYGARPSMYPRYDPYSNYDRPYGSK